MPKGPLCRRYSGGHFELDEKRKLVVSRGVGCSLMPIRLFANPQIHLFEIRHGGPGHLDDG
jgi:hypothetical protein